MEGESFMRTKSSAGFSSERPFVPTTQNIRCPVPVEAREEFQMLVAMFSARQETSC